MTLEEIRRLLRFADRPTESCKEVNEFLDEHIGHVAERMLELRHLKSQLEALHETCRGIRPIIECEILQGLATGTLRSAKSVRNGHVHGAHRR